MTSSVKRLIAVSKPQEESTKDRQPEPKTDPNPVKNKPFDQSNYLVLVVSFVALVSLPGRVEAQSRPNGPSSLPDKESRTAQAKLVSDFRQREPHEGEHPTEKTE